MNIDSNIANEAAIARRGRVVALVIAAGGLAAFLAPGIGQVLHLSSLFEMVCHE